MIVRFWPPTRMITSRPIFFSPMSAFSANGIGSLSVALPVANGSLLSSLPLFWVAGLVIRALPTLAAGCELVLVIRDGQQHTLTVTLGSRDN